MCGRFTNQYTWEELHRLYSLADDCLPLNFAPRYNMAPSQDGLIVRLEDGKRQVKFHRWGLIPPWAKDHKIGYKMINARSETAAEKPSFRSSFKSRRCLVVADGFFEWPEKGKPRYIYTKDGRPFAFAGLWETWNSPDGPVESFTILTCAPNAFLAEVHNRMPVMLRPEDWAMWLGETAASLEEIRALMKPYPSEYMDSRPADPKVGNVKNDDPSLID